MSLANGRPYLAIPGPSVIPDQVLQAMQRPSPNIYEGELHEITLSLYPDLRRVAQTDGDVVIYIGNGHASWEAALANVLSPGDKVLVLASGTFGTDWGDMAVGLGAIQQVLDFGMSAPADPARVEAALRADKSHEIKAVTLCHVDTSTGVKTDVAAIRAAMDAAGHPALLMVDCIASLGCDRFEMDAWGVDIMVAACQKGLMTPAGICFVWFNAKAKAARGTCVTSHWDWLPRIDPEVYFYRFNGTAPTHHIYGLRTALDMMMAEGMPAIWDRHAALARALWAACDAWSTLGPLALNVADPADRSCAVTSIALGAGNGDALRGWSEHQAGLTLGLGIGRTPASGYFRVGHMGHINAHMMMGVIGTIEAGLCVLDIPHGGGALDAAARVIAGSAPT